MVFRWSLRGLNFSWEFLPTLELLQLDKANAPGRRPKVANCLFRGRTLGRRQGVISTGVPTLVFENTVGIAE